MNGRRDTYFHSANLHVYGVRQFGGDRVVVTFGSYRMPGLDDAGFGERFLHKYQIDAVHIVPASNAWFQYREMPAALAAVKAQTAPYARRVTYGSSMGGYAAINFSDVLDADAVIAISPQFSVDPAKMPEDRRWRHETERLRFRHDNIAWLRRRPRSVHIVYDDRHELDRRHVTAIAKAVELIEVRVPFAGHPAAGLLVEAGLLSHLVIQLIDESFDPDDFARRYIGLAPQTAAYNASLAAFLPAERLADKLRHARFAVKRQPASLAYRHLLSDLLMQAGEHDAAVAMLQELAEQHSSAAETHFALAIALEGAGRIPEAAAASRAALARAPHSPTLWRLLGRLAWRQNRPTAVLTATINTTWEWLPRWRRRFTAGR